MADIQKIIEQFIRDTTISPTLNRPEDFVENKIRAERIRAAIPKILRSLYENVISIEEFEVKLQELKEQLDNFDCDCNPDNQGSSGDMIFDSTFHITGAKDYVNTIYKTRFSYLSGTTNVYVNGVRLTRGGAYDYEETADKTIQLTFPLFPTDQISINYYTSGENGLFVTDYSYNITGAKNGVNTLFSLSREYIGTSTNVYLNGMKLTRGIDYDYVEMGGKNIQFNFPPASTDLITVDYKTTESIIIT